MNVIPAVDILDGKVVTLVGETGTEKVSFTTLTRSLEWEVRVPV